MFYKKILLLIVFLLVSNSRAATLVEKNKNKNLRDSYSNKGFVSTLLCGSYSKNCF